MQNTKPVARSLAESLITLMIHSDEFGKLVAYSVTPDLFDGDYRMIAERVLRYWATEKRAPGLAHADDLFEDILGDPRNKKAREIRRVLQQSSLLYEEQINVKYVMRKLSTHKRQQALKRAILEAAQKLNDDYGGDNIAEVEDVLAEVLRTRTIDFDSGLRLSAYETLLKPTEIEQEFDTGIAVLDENHIVPVRGTIINLLAPSGYGKSWWLIHLARRAMLRRQRVLHITLELSADETLKRYYQSIYAIPKRAMDRITIPELEVDRQGFLRGLTDYTIEPGFSLASPNLRLELESRFLRHEYKLNSVIIKQFPQRQLSFNGLVAYLDTLEAMEGFVPDLLIIDYPKLMKISTKDFRLELGVVYSDLKGLLTERNMAGAFVHQVNRTGSTRRVVQATDMGEDISILHTCDTIITHSATEQERQLGLARLFVNKCRHERDHFSLVINQNYDIGQYALNSAKMVEDYERYRAIIGEIDAGAGDNESEGESEAILELRQNPNARR